MSDFGDDVGQIILNAASRAMYPAGRYLVRKLRERANARREALAAAVARRADVSAGIVERNLAEPGGGRWAAIVCDCAERTPQSMRGALEGGVTIGAQSVARMREAISRYPTEAMMRADCRSLADLLAEGSPEGDSPADREAWIGRACERFREQGGPVSAGDVGALLDAMGVAHEPDGRSVMFHEDDVENVERAWSMLAGPDEQAFTLNGDEEQRLVSVVMGTHEQAQELERELDATGIDASRDGREVVASVRSGGLADEAGTRARIERMSEQVARRHGEATPEVASLEDVPITRRQTELIERMCSERGLELNADALASLSRADANFVISTVLEADGRADLGGAGLSPERQLEVCRQLNVPVPTISGHPGSPDRDGATTDSREGATPPETPARPDQGRPDAPERPKADARLSALSGGTGVRRSDAGWERGHYRPAVSELDGSAGPGVTLDEGLQQSWDSPADLDVDGDGIRDVAEDANGDGVPDDREPRRFEQDSLEDTISDAVAINEEMTAVERAGRDLPGVALEDSLHGARV